MNKHQKKYSNTAIKMNQALIALMEKQTFDSITIKSLCEKAGINRSTFYSHYQNLSELLEETRRYVVGLFIEETKDLHLTLDHYRSLPDEFLIPYLRVFQEHRNIFLISAFHPGTYRFTEEHRLMFEQISVPLCAASGITDRKTISYLTEYSNSGCHAIVMQWLEGGCTEPISYICSLLRFCLLGHPLVAVPEKP